MKSLARPERWNSNCKRGAGKRRSPQSVRSAGDWMDVRVQLAKGPNVSPHQPLSISDSSIKIWGGGTPSGLFFFDFCPSHALFDCDRLAGLRSDLQPMRLYFPGKARVEESRKSQRKQYRINISQQVQKTRLQLVSNEPNNDSK